LYSVSKDDLPHLPVGNCAEANLVSRIPAPSINASSIPPIAAEPNMATGPSVMSQEINITQINTRHLKINKYKKKNIKRMHLKYL